MRPNPRYLCTIVGLFLLSAAWASCGGDTGPGATEPTAGGGDPGEGSTAEGVGTAGRGGSGDRGGSEVRQVEPRADPLTGLPMVPVPSRAGAPSRGPEGAPLQVVVFTDFQCPYCRMHAEALGQLVEHYGDRIRLTVRQFPLPFHDMARPAAEAALAANAEGKFWRFHDLLFAAAAGGLTRDLIFESAQKAGLDMSRFQRGLDAGFFAGIVDKDIRDGESIGVSATPTTFLNGRMLSGAVGLERLIEICDQLLP
jgi:protein-disulfide isomerase